MPTPRPRYHPPTSLPSPPPLSPHTNLLSSLTHILHNYPPPSPSPHPTHHPPHPHATGAGLYHGPTSIAFLFYRLSQLFPQLAPERQSCKHWALAYLPPPHPTIAIDPSHCGVGVESLARAAVRAVVTQDAALAGELCGEDVLLALTGEAAGSDEWLYGRSGYLYLLRFLRATFPQRSIRGAIDAAIRRVVARVMDTLREKPAGWEWHGRRYLGLVHGAAGILVQVALSCGVVGDPVPGELEGVVRALLRAQGAGGGWSSSFDRQGDEARLVQICHGAAGVVVALEAVKPFFAGLGGGIERAVERGREVVRARGVLGKDPGLCHGVVGNALALGGEEGVRWLGWATRGFLEGENRGGRWFGGGEGEGDGEEEVFGLWTGEGGRAWGFAVAELVREGRGEWMGRLVGFNDL